MQLVPKSFFLTRGVGVHRERLTAFELALREADIEQQNIVTISSIMPPNCVELEREKGVATLLPGEITFSVLARAETDEPGRRVNASIGLARPTNPVHVRLHLGASRLRHEGGTERRLRRRSRSIHAGFNAGHRVRPRRSMGRAQAGVPD